MPKNTTRNVEAYKNMMPKVPDNFKELFEDVINSSYIAPTQNTSNLSPMQKKFYNSIYTPTTSNNFKKAGPQHMFDRLMVGTLTMREFFDHAQIDPEQYKKYGDDVLCFAVEHLVGKVYHLRHTTEDKKWFKCSTVDQDFYNSSSTNGLYDLDIKDKDYTLWDKFFQFFGFTTDHAKKVDFYNQCQKSLNERIYEVELETNVFMQKEDINEIIKEGESYQQDRINYLKACSDNEKKWKKLFFGDVENIPEYKFDLGDKKISGLAACIAMLNNKYPDGLLERLVTYPDMIDTYLNDDSVDISIDEFREIGTNYLKYVSEKEKINAESEKYGIVNDFLFDDKSQRNNKLSPLDKKLLKEMHPGANKEKETAPGVVEKKDVKPYPKFGDFKKKNLKNDYIHLKAKQELAELFSSKDTIYGTLSEGDKERIKAIEEMENSVKVFEKLKNHDLLDMNKLLPDIENTTDITKVLAEVDKNLARADYYMIEDGFINAESKGYIKGRCKFPEDEYSVFGTEIEEEKMIDAKKENDDDFEFGNSIN